MTTPPPQNLDRRRFLAGVAGIGVTFHMLPDHALAASSAAPSRRKMVVIICRGAMDGLAVAPLVNDPDYHALRGPLAIGREALRLDGDFSLHPSLAATHALAKAGQARIAPAVAMPGFIRSHFEAQDALEAGVAGAQGAASGWLNRSVEALSARGGVGALSVGATLPLILRGKAVTASWSPGRSVNAQARLPTLLQDLYRDDAILGPALAQGLETEAMAQAAMSNLADSPDATVQQASMAAAPATKTSRDGPRKLGATVAGFMRNPGGPQIATLSLDGFDTHANQGALTGQLANRLTHLDAIIDGLHAGLGPDWKNTVVVVVTEFGRTVRMNGTRGTDHGTASTAILAGGALKPGGIIGDWPGLKPGALYENRDLRPTVDMRGLFKGVLAEHMGIDRATLDAKVFPDSAIGKPVLGLV